MKILIVEDEIGLREVLKAVFEGEYEVKTAENGTEALRILSVWQPDVMLTDFAMPGMTGLELIRAIRKMNNIVGAIHESPLRNSSIHQIKTILYSACMTDDIRQEARELGVAGCMEKPFDLEALRGMIRRLKCRGVT